MQWSMLNKLFYINIWKFFISFPGSTRYQAMKIEPMAVFNLQKRSNGLDFMFVTHIIQKILLNCSHLLLISRDWWWSNGWNLVSLLGLILRKISTVWIVVYNPRNNKNIAVMPLKSLFTPLFFFFLLLYIFRWLILGLWI